VIPFDVAAELCYFFGAEINVIISAGFLLMKLNS